MLYTIIGTDIDKVRARSRSLTSALQEKRPDASSFRLHHENFSPDRFTELLGSIGLFSSKYIVTLDNLLTGDAAKKEAASDDEGSSGGDKGTPGSLIRENLDALKKSDHVWVIVEDALFGQSTGKELGVKQTKELADMRKELEKFSDKIETHEKGGRAASRGWGGKSGKPGQVTSFAFTDAFFDKNTIQSLKALSDLEAAETAPEEIHGALWWQTKALCQVAAGEDKKLSPFVAGKSKRFLRKWNAEDLQRLSNNMIDSYHLAHLGKTDLKDELMRMVLGFK